MKGTESLNKLDQRLNNIFVGLSILYCFSLLVLIIVGKIVFEHYVFFKIVVPLTIFLLIYTSISLKLHEYIDECENVQEEYELWMDSIDTMERIIDSKRQQSQDDFLIHKGLKIYYTSISEPTFTQQRKEIMEKIRSFEYPPEPFFVKILQKILR